MFSHLTSLPLQYTLKRKSITSIMLKPRNSLSLERNTILHFTGFTWYQPVKGELYAAFPS